MMKRKRKSLQKNKDKKNCCNLLLRFILNNIDSNSSHKGKNFSIKNSRDAGNPFAFPNASLASSKIITIVNRESLGFCRCIILSISAESNKDIAWFSELSLGSKRRC